MAMVQELSPRTIPSTFGKPADYFLKQLVELALSVPSNVVHFVVDTYRKDSIKNAERGQRSVGGSLLKKSTVQIRRYLTNGRSFWHVARTKQS